MGKIKILVFCLVFLFLILLDVENSQGEEPRILIRDSGPDYKIFSLTVKVVNCSYRNFKIPFEIIEKDTEKICEDDINFLNRFFKIEGINSVSAEPYEVIIKRGRAFKWENIESEVLKILKERFGENKDKVTVVYEAQSK